MTLARRLDAAHSFWFEVIFTGPPVLAAGLIGVIRGISGLDDSLEVTEYYPGGGIEPTHLLGKRRRAHLVLEGAVVPGPLLWAWFASVNPTVPGSLNLAKAHGTIALLGASPAGPMPVGIWDVTGALPIGYKGPVVSVSSNAIAVEKIEIVHDGLMRFE